MKKINNHFQYERINNILEQYGTKFTIESMILVSDDIFMSAYGFKFKNEIYHVIKELNGKYRVCKVKNKKIYATYSQDLSFKTLRIVLKNLLN